MHYIGIRFVLLTHSRQPFARASNEPGSQSRQKMQRVAHQNRQGRRNVGCFQTPRQHPFPRAVSESSAPASPSRSKPKPSFKKKKNFDGVLNSFCGWELGFFLFLTPFLWALAIISEKSLILPSVSGYWYKTPATSFDSKSMNCTALTSSSTPMSSALVFSTANVCGCTRVDAMNFFRLVCLKKKEKKGRNS